MAIFRTFRPGNSGHHPEYQRGKKDEITLSQDVVAEQSNGGRHSLNPVVGAGVSLLVHIPHWRRGWRRPTRGTLPVLHHIGAQSIISVPQSSLPTSSRRLQEPPSPHTHLANACHPTRCEVLMCTAKRKCGTCARRGLGIE